MALEEWHRWWKSRGRSELRALLMAQWDPIGIKGVPEARDEYDRYLDPLAHQLRDGADTQAIAGYLANIQTRHMGLPIAASQLVEVAEHIHGWHVSEMQG